MRFWTSIVLLAFCASLAAGESASGMHNTQTEAEAAPEHGKLATSDASPVEPGHFELEFIHDFTYSGRSWDRHGQTRDEPVSRQHDGLAQLTIGALPDLDFNLRTGVTKFTQGSDESTDASDTTIGSRWRFIHRDIEKRHLEIAWLAAITIPSAEFHDDAPASQGFYSASSSVVMTKDWGKFTMDAEVGASIPFGARRRDARVGIIANIAAGYQLLSWLQPEVELNTRYDLSARRGNDARAVAITAGLVMPINEHLRVNAGVQQGLVGRNAAQNTTAILAVKLSW